MADWPDTDEDGKRPAQAEEYAPDDGADLGHNRKKDRNAGSRGGSAGAFLAGALAMLFIIAALQIGWMAAGRADLWHGAAETDSEEKENAGAAVLTDQETLYKLAEIQKLIEDHYLNEVESGDLSTYLFKGAAAGLQDPYAAYYSVEELQSVIDSSRGEYMGIGITLLAELDTGRFVVAEIYDGSPAARAGMQTGDVLLSVDGTAVDGMSLDEVVAAIKSKESAFPVEIYREDTGETLEKELSCEEILLQYVEYKMLEDGIGYLSLSEFTELAVTQFEDALQALQDQGMESLIVDLRGNPGGLLSSVCDILDEIVPEGLIVYTEDKDGNREEYYTDDSYSVSCPVAVLVNGRSASASEIFAGAVQDLGIGPVVGAKTYGKGIVQDTYYLSDGSAFKLTTEKYFTPNGQDIDGDGIQPDIAVEGADDFYFGPEAGAGDARDEAQTDAGDTGEEGRTDTGDTGDEAQTDIVLERAVEALLEWQQK